ncbi:MAG: type II secretion system F family protein [Candidatus Thermoplasmatota archaeon]|nr:type II secretion system F family protein [Candidatus Thermoplasmatota archaeon]
MSVYYKFCMRLPLFKRYGKKLSDDNPEMEITLAKANKNIRGEVYYTVMLVSTFFAFIVGLILTLFLNLIFLPSMGVGLPIRMVIYIILPIMAPTITFFIYNFLPKNTILERRKSIDRNISYATNYMAAMASADVTPSAIFRGLAKQAIYGEIQKESEKIARDIDFFGRDLVKVLQKAIARSPSEKFQEFLQGIITTANSGGSLKMFFMSKSEQFMKENRLQQEKDLQTLGVMAESFVTVVVAAPLFLIIMMSTMAMMGQKGGDTLLMATIFLMIPVMQLVFAVLIGDTGEK